MTVNAGSARFSALTSPHENTRQRGFSSLRTEGTLRRAEKTAAGMRLRGRLKRSQPQDRKQIETYLHAVGGENRRTGEKPAGRNTANASQAFARRNQGNPEPGVDSNRRNDEGAHLWKTPGEEVEQEIVQRLSTNASGRTAQKGRGWISQTFNGLRELLPVVAENQQGNLPRLRAAEAKCNELHHRWGPRTAETNVRCGIRREADFDTAGCDTRRATPQIGAEYWTGCGASSDFRIA